MSFLAPAAFWFAATIPVVVLFYLLKRKRVVKLVSSTLLWQRFLAETQANAPFQRLRYNWLLILQLLLLVLAVLALSRPFFAGSATENGFRVIILDSSASMQSTDEIPSRFEKARIEAMKLVDAMQGQTETLVLLAGATTEVKQSATTEKTALRRALEACKASDCPTRLTEALKLADTMVRNKKNAEIHLFSDGVAPGLTDFENSGLRVIYHRIGQRCNNLGITTLDIRANPENRQQRALYTSVVNFSTNAMETELELLFDGQVVDARVLKVAAGETSPQVFLASQPHDGVFTVRIDAKDDLLADNQASIVSLLPQPVRILLVSRGNRFLEKALRAAGDVNLTVSQNYMEGNANCDLVVLDDVTPVTWPKENLLAVHVVNTNWFDSVSKSEFPTIVDWKSAHPLLRYINFDNVQISESLAVKTPSWAISLVDAQQTPLVLAGEMGRQKIVWIGFDTLQSTWPLRISFPMFIANAVEWLNPVATKSGEFSLRSGDTFRYRMTETAGVLPPTFEVTLPDGTKRALPFVNSREIVFGDTSRQGTYRLRAGTNDLAFCVNLLDAAESNIKPRETLQFGKFNTVAATEVKRSNVELWRWIAGLGLAVLLFEWWFYHRRTT